MKQFFMLLLFAIGFQLSAQTHHIGLNFGVNQLLSIDEGPPFGNNNPWEARIGFANDLSYHFSTKRGFTYGLNMNALFPRFIHENRSELIGEGNELITADRVSIHTYLSLCLNLGYKWDLGPRYSLHFSLGSGLMYNQRQKSYFRNDMEIKRVNTYELKEENTSYQIQIGLEQSYTLKRGRNFRLNLVGSIRAAQIFDYMKLSEQINRILPQAYLGVELELGRRRR